MDWDQHPNYLRQKQEAADAEAQRVRDVAHAEALEDQADHIRKQIEAILSGTGFSLDVDTWGSGGIVLEYWAQGAPGPSFETPLEGKE